MSSSKSIKENNGELDFRTNAASKSSLDATGLKRRKPRPSDSTGKLLIALLGGAGAAFLLGRYLRFYVSPISINHKFNPNTHTWILTYLAY